MEAEWKNAMMEWWKKIESNQVKPTGELLTEAVTKAHRRNETQRSAAPGSRTNFRACKREAGPDHLRRRSCLKICIKDGCNDRLSGHDR